LAASTQVCSGTWAHIRTWAGPPSHCCNGMTGEERPGAGGEVEALRPPARSPLFAGASSRHHLPTVGRPTPLFLPGRIAEPVLAPGALADSMPEVKKGEGPRYLP
jgi:hypothetical protein